MDPGDAALLESWELSLHARRPRTVANYVRDVRWFADWLADKGLALAEKRDVEGWIGSMRDRGLKGNTIRTRFMAVRSFYRWALEEQEVTVNPTERIQVLKPHEPAPDVLTGEQVAALLKACEGTGFAERRDLALIRLMVATGLRASEVCAIELGDLDLPNRIAAVRDGKGGRSRVVRFDPATGAALDRYRRVRARNRHAALPALWLGTRGPMTPGGGLSIMLSRRAKQAGIGHVFPHQLRHTWADRWLAAGGTEGDLQKLGGWESSDVMRRYGSARAVDRALGAYDQIDPMRGL